MLFESSCGNHHRPAGISNIVFDFGDGTWTDWMSERKATHTYSTSGNGSYPGPCRNCLDIPRSRYAEQSNRQRCRCYRTVKKSDTQRDGVRHYHTLANSTPSPTSTYTPIATAVPTAIPSITPIPPPPPPLRPSKMPWLYSLSPTMLPAPLPAGWRVWIRRSRSRQC